MEALGRSTGRGNNPKARGVRQARCADERPGVRAGIGVRDDAAIVRVAAMYRVLGDPTRIRIVLALTLGETCVSAIVRPIGVSASAVSHSLAELRRTGLVRHRRQGRTVYYTLAGAGVARLLEAGLRLIGGGTTRTGTGRPRRGQKKST